MIPPFGKDTQGPAARLVNSFLQEWSKGEEAVRMGLKPGEINVDGPLNKTSIEFLRTFQTASTINATGVCDKATWDAMRAAGNDVEAEIASIQDPIDLVVNGNTVTYRSGVEVTPSGNGRAEKD